MTLLMVSFLLSGFYMLGGRRGELPIAHAAGGFTQGNLVVYRVGDGLSTLNGNSAPVFLDEYATDGTLVQSIALPTVVSGANKRLVASGSATTEGFLTLSADGKYVVLTGYDTPVNSAGIQAGGSFSSNFATASLAPSIPPYNIAYNYAGDNNFNATSGTGTLTVGYGITALFDQTKAAKSGSTIPIKLQLSNASGVNLSSSSIIVTAVSLVQTSTSATSAVQDSGSANPDGNFRFTGDGYIFNLNTKGLTAGTWQLMFSVSGDPTLRALMFQVR